MNFDKYVVIPKSDIDKYGDECLLIVCTASHEQSGRKFFSTVKWILNHFEKITVVLADTLDRYNFMSAGYDAETAKKKGIQRANEWLEKHEPAITRFFEGNNYNLIRWSEIEERPDFEERLSIVNELYENNDMAKLAINDICLKHLEISKQRGNAQSGNEQLAFQNSVKYMLNEVAGLSQIASEFQAPEIYAGLIFENKYLFQQINFINPSIDMTLPSVIQVEFERNNLVHKNDNAARSKTLQPMTA